MKNLQRVTDMLLSATTKEGDDYSVLEELYGEVFAQRNRELGHVVPWIGGVIETRKVAGQEGTVYTPVSRAKQKESMEYLLNEGFRTPSEFIRADILALIEPSGTVDRVLQGHRQLLSRLLDNQRFDRLMTTAALGQGKEKPYTLAEMLADLRNGIWKELKASRVSTDLYRRNLQRAYIDLMGTKLNPAPFTPPVGAPAGVRFSPPSPLPTEARSLIRQELMDLDAALARALPSAADRETKAHLQDSRYQISRILYPDSK
jgi:hypothetical protein